MYVRGNLEDGVIWEPGRSVSEINTRVVRDFSAEWIIVDHSFLVGPTNLCPKE